MKWECGYRDGKPMPSAKTKASKRRYGEDSDDSEEIIQPPPKR